MARTVKDQADRMAAMFGGKEPKPQDAETSKPQDAKEPKRQNVKLSVYLDPDVAEALDKAWLANRQEAGERKSRSDYIENLLRNALGLPPMAP